MALGAQRGERDLAHADVLRHPAHRPPLHVEHVEGDEDAVEKFKYALHEGYSGLNDLEAAFARAIDRTRRVWCRNPAAGGFAIDLLDSDFAQYGSDPLIAPLNVV